MKGDSRLVTPVKYEYVFVKGLTSCSFMIPGVSKSQWASFSSLNVSWSEGMLGAKGQRPQVTLLSLHTNIQSNISPHPLPLSLHFHQKPNCRDQTRSHLAWMWCQTRTFCQHDLGTGGQTDMRMGGQTDRHEDRCTQGQVDRQTWERVDMRTVGHEERQTWGQADTRTGGQTDSLTHKVAPPAEVSEPLHLVRL